MRSIERSSTSRDNEPVAATAGGGRWRGRVGALLAGAVPAVAFPGPAVWVAGLVALVPALLVVRAAPTLAEGIRRTWLAGIGFFVTVTWFLVPNVGPALPIIAALLAASWLPAGGFAWWALHAPPTPRRLAVGLVVVPAAWVAGEYLRSWQYLGGPWAVLGASQWNDRRLLPLAAIGGVWLISAVLVAVNLAVAAAATPAATTRARLVAGLAALTVLGVGFGAAAARPAPPVLGEATIAGIQPGVIVGSDARFAASEQLTRQILAGRPDLIVWGESSVGTDPLAQPDYLRRIERLARAAGTDLLVNVDANHGAAAPGAAAASRAAAGGGGAAGSGGGIYKTALLIGPDGVLGWYDKRRLVPFGEYVPLRPLLAWTDRVSRAAGTDRRRGSRTVLMTTSAGLRVGPLICFESAFGDMSRRLVVLGAQLIVVQSSTSSFQQSWAPEQHASLAAVRAAETGRSVVHATLTGVSAAFDPTGRRLTWVGTSQAGGYLVRVPLTGGTTPYVRYGDWLPRLGLIVLIAAILVALARRRRGSTPVSTAGGRRPQADSEG